MGRIFYYYLVVSKKTLAVVHIGFNKQGAEAYAKRNKDFVVVHRKAFVKIEQDV